jgi:hypothetical protein
MRKGAGTDPRIRNAVIAERETWDRATEKRADAEFALEQFQEGDASGDTDRCDELHKAVEKARKEELAAQRVYSEALDRALRGAK